VQRRRVQVQESVRYECHHRLRHHVGRRLRREQQPIRLRLDARHHAQLEVHAVQAGIEVVLAVQLDPLGRVQAVLQQCSQRSELHQGMGSDGRQDRLGSQFAESVQGALRRNADDKCRRDDDVPRPGVQHDLLATAVPQQRVLLRQPDAVSPTPIGPVQNAAQRSGNEHPTLLCVHRRDTQLHRRECRQVDELRLRLLGHAHVQFEFADEHVQHDHASRTAQF